MEKKQLGNTDLEIYPIFFGGNVLGWTIDQKTSFTILDAFTHGGFNAIDTADIYSKWAPGNSGGESETIIGKWAHSKKNRKDLIIATKVGGDMGYGKTGLSKKHILAAAEASLKRLQTDYIDLYQTHFDDTSIPISETLEAYQQLVQEGKVRWIGASNLTVERLKESFAIVAENIFPAYQTFQPHYNLYQRQQFEDGLEPICLGHNLGVITYFSLENGFLSGKYRSTEDLSKSVRGAGMRKYFNQRGFQILDALDKVANEHNTTQAAVALAWLIQRPSVTAPIVSATNLQQIESIAAAPNLNLGIDAIRFLTAESSWQKKTD